MPWLTAANKDLTNEASFWFDKRSTLSVHLLIETTRVAEVLTGTVTSPQRRRRGTAVDAFPTYVRYNAKTA